MARIALDMPILKSWQMMAADWDMDSDQRRMYEKIFILGAMVAIHRYGRHSGDVVPATIDIEIRTMDARRKELQ